MTKIEKLEREKKWLKYILIVLMGIYILRVISIIVVSKEIETRIVVTIAALLIGIVLYLFLRFLVEIVINEKNDSIKNEKLKLEVKEQFNLSSEKYVEIFWNEANEDEFSISCGMYLKSVNMRFFVKLISEDEIEMVEKNKEGKIIGEPHTITYFGFLREYFKTQP